MFGVQHNRRQTKIKSHSMTSANIVVIEYDIGFWFCDSVSMPDRQLFIVNFVVTHPFRSVSIVNEQLLFVPLLRNHFIWCLRSVEHLFCFQFENKNETEKTVTKMPQLHSTLTNQSYLCDQFHRLRHFNLQTSNAVTVASQILDECIRDGWFRSTTHCPLPMFWEFHDRKKNLIHKLLCFCFEFAEFS